MTVVAGLELGGTKAIALLARGQEILEQASIPTRAPAETLADVAGWLAARKDQFSALGIASFGPLRVSRQAPDYGTILSTPKPGWSGTPLLPCFFGLGVPIRIDTDVNAAALAERAWGAGQGCSSLVYLTVGTGIGAGILVEGQPVHGRLHPEAGHIRTGPAADGFAGACPFHGDCIEGLVSGFALARRFEADPATLLPGDARWQAPARDFARFLAALILTLAPERILVGGSVALNQPEWLQTAICNLPAELGDYFPDLDAEALAQMIGPPALGERAGPLGAIRLAELALA